MTNIDGSSEVLQIKDPWQVEKSLFLLLRAKTGITSNISFANCDIFIDSYNTVNVLVPRMTTERAYVTFHCWHYVSKLTKIITWGLFILTWFNIITEITYIMMYGRKFIVYSQIYSVDVCEWISHFIPMLLNMWLFIHAGT